MSVMSINDGYIRFRVAALPTTHSNCRLHPVGGCSMGDAEEEHLVDADEHVDYIYLSLEASIFGNREQ